MVGEGQGTPTDDEVRIADDLNLCGEELMTYILHSNGQFQKPSAVSTLEMDARMSVWLPRCVVLKAGKELGTIHIASTPREEHLTATAVDMWSERCIETRLSQQVNLPCRRPLPSLPLSPLSL
jgi:hypothetical protein